MRILWSILRGSAINWPICARERWTGWRPSRRRAAENADLMVIWWVEGRMALAREPLAAAAGGSGNRVVERRQFLTGSLAILVVTLGAEAQPHDKHLCRVGFLGSGTPSLPLFRAQR